MLDLFATSQMTDALISLSKGVVKLLQLRQPVWPSKNESNEHGLGQPEALSQHRRPKGE